MAAFLLTQSLFCSLTGRQKELDKALVDLIVKDSQPFQLRKMKVSGTLSRNLTQLHNCIQKYLENNREVQICREQGQKAITFD